MERKISVKKRLLEGNLILIKKVSSSQALSFPFQQAVQTKQFQVLHRPLQPVSNLQLDLSGRYDMYQFFFMLLNVGDQNNDGTLTMKEMMEVWKKLEGKDFSEEEAQFFFHDPSALVPIKESF